MEVTKDEGLTNELLFISLGYRNDGGFERRGQYGGGGDGGSSWREDRGGFGGGSRDDKITIQVANNDIGKLIGKLLTMPI